MRKSCKICLINKISLISQISLEFIMTMSMMVIIFTSMIVISTERRQDSYEYQNERLIRNPCEYVASLLTNIYLLGDGASSIDRLDYNMTVFGKDHLLMIWEYSDYPHNNTYYCKYPQFDVTNSYNTSFVIPLLTQFQVENVRGTVEVRDAALYDGLVLWLRMDGNDTSSSIYDSSWNGNNANLSGVSCATAGFARQGCVLANNGYLVVKDNPTLRLPYNFTISAWVKPTSASGTRLIIGKNSSYGLYLRTARAGFYNANPENPGWLISNVTSVPANTWKLITATYNGSYLTVYLNASKLGLVANASPFDTTPGQSGSLLIGGVLSSDISTGNFSGTIDDVRIYNRSLSTSEVRRLYDSYFNYVETKSQQFPR